MAELTPQLIEGLMSNIPPQQDFRRAVTIVSADPGSVVYQIEVPESRFDARYRTVAAKYCASACSYLRRSPRQRCDFGNERSFESSARKRSDAPSKTRFGSDRSNTHHLHALAHFLAAGSGNPLPNAKAGGPESPPSFNARDQQ